MKHAPTALRIILGLIYFVFGLNGFLNFLPQPPSTEAAGAFAGAMVATGYFFPVLKITEVLGGVALLSGFFTPLSLVILAPITLQIFLFHAFLAPAGMFIQVFMLVLHLALGWLNRSSYSELLKLK